MVDMPSTSDASEKFGRRGSQAGQDYEQGVSDSSDSDWQEGAVNGQDNWATGVQDAISNGSYETGVRNPNASWQQRSLELGSQRFGQGIQAATGKYETAVEPFFQALESLSLDPRGPRGSEQNFQRAQQVGRRLHELRQQR